MWLLLFNVATTIYVIVGGSLHWDAISICTYGVVLLFMNCIAWISARKCKGWK